MVAAVVAAVVVLPAVEAAVVVAVVITVALAVDAVSFGLILYLQIVLLLFLLKRHYGWTYGPTEYGPRDGRTYRQSDPLIEMRGRI